MNVDGEDWNANFVGETALLQIIPEVVFSCTAQRIRKAYSLRARGSLPKWRKLAWWIVHKIQVSSC